MFYEIQYDICSILIYGFSLYYVLAYKGVKRVQNRFFALLVFNGILSAVFDILSAISLDYPELFSVAGKTTVTYIYLILHCLQAWIILMFGCYSFAFWTDRKIRIRNQWIFATLYLVELIVLFINPFTGFAFRFDASGRYLRGALYPVFYAISIVYLVILLTLIVIRRKNVSRYLMGCFFFYITASVIAAIIQLMRPQLLIELFVQSLGCMGLMLAISSQEDNLDRVTGLFNEDVFMEDNRYAIGAQPYSLIVVRITNLPYYNATVGVPMVEGTLKQIAFFLKAHNEGRTYYVGNGVFAMMLINIPEGDVRREIAALRSYFQESIVYQDVSLAFHTQILHINVPRDASTIEKIMLLTHAQYRTDNRRCTVYDGDELRFVERDVEIEKALKRALKNRTLSVYLQPIWWREDNKIHSAEALMRLFDDDLGMVSTEEFIAVAEKTGLIYDIGIYIMEEVCKMFRMYDFKGFGIEYIEVNLSAIQCMRRGLTREFKRILEENHLDGKHINLEITESAAADNAELLAENVRRLQELGCTFSLDDYGTGYSNFTYILELAFDNIKLDRSILWSTATNENARSILRHSIRMIQEIGWKALVEGVETEEQKDMLCDFGCDLLQGFFFSKPVDVETFVAFCKEFNGYMVD
ncbi:MAG: EAL domain-containing protein [Lachnospiraceae bacterium]|nr:EAL domain-containing protein [Lachnospiraceae bacterium]